MIKTTKDEISYTAFAVPEDIKAVIENVSDPAILKCLTSQELSQYMVELSVYALSLKNSENRFKSYMNWCDANIRYIVGCKLPDVTAYSFQEKDLIIRSSDPTAREFEVKRLSAQVKLDSIREIPDKIEVLINTLRNFYFERRNQNGTGKTA